MADNIGTLLTSPIRPASDQDTFPTSWANEALGGSKIVTNITERNNIPLDRRISGEVCYVSNEKKYI